MKRFLGILTLTLLLTVAAWAARTVMVSGAGMGIDQDQSTADATADSQAQNNVENACPGTLTSKNKIFDQCSQAGDNYVCNVNYTGICQVGR